MPPILMPTDASTGNPYSQDDIKRRVEKCPKLASLQSINQALNKLVRSEASLTSQIAEIIQRDPSLSERLLRMVNSVYFNLSAQVNNIEEAVFFLGIRQIRELSMATPVIEDLGHLQAFAPAPKAWKELWAHSICTAQLTREILGSMPGSVDNDMNYMVGLLHNVGRLVMAYAFPKELMAIAGTEAATPEGVCEIERTLIGWDHTQIGAHFLEKHAMSDEIICAVRHHHDPAQAPRHQIIAAAIQIADHAARQAGFQPGFETVAAAAPDAFHELEGWRILYANDENDIQVARAMIINLQRRLPDMLSGLL